MSIKYDEMIVELKKAIELEELKLKLESLHSERLKIVNGDTSKPLYADDYLEKLQSALIQKAALDDISFAMFTPAYNGEEGKSNTRSVQSRSPSPPSLSATVSPLLPLSAKKG